MLKHFLLPIFLLFGFLQAEIVMPIQKGWSLIGVPQDLDDLSSFDEENVEIVWAYDAQAQEWMAYSADEKIAQKLSLKNIVPLESLTSHQGFWVLSSKEWVLTFDKTDEESNRSKNIELRSG